MIDLKMTINTCYEIENVFLKTVKHSSIYFGSCITNIIYKAGILNVIHYQTFVHEKTLDEISKYIINILEL